MVIQENIEEMSFIQEETPGQGLQAPVTVSSSSSSQSSYPQQKRQYDYSSPVSIISSQISHMDSQNTVIQTTNPLNFINAPSRTVYLGNIPDYLSLSQLLDHVNSGIVEDCTIVKDKRCAFITFLDENSALLFHSDSILKRLNIDGNDVKIGWGKSNLMDPLVATRIKYEHATRNVYIGNLNSGDDSSTNQKEVFNEERLQKDFSQFGQIDCIDYIQDKGIAFIHFASIFMAIKAVDNIMDLKPKYRNKRVSFGKDRCANITKLQQYNAAQFLGLNNDDLSEIRQLNDRDFITNTLLQQSAATAAIATSAGGPNNLGNRTIFLGNLPKGVKIEDICNVVRGGILQNIKLIPDKNICFITFIDPTAAAQFYAMSSLHGFTLQKKRCRIGWGKHSGPLPNDLGKAIGHGASRNVYIGNINFKNANNEYYTEENLRDIFGNYGSIEQINFLPEKGCCFINFTNIQNAIVAISEIQSLPQFKDTKINFGKDRCGNIPQQTH